MTFVVYWCKQFESINLLATARVMRTAMGSGVLSLALVSGLASSVLAQPNEVKIQVIPQSSVVWIERTGNPQSSWSFVDSYAGSVGLGRRIRNFTAFDARGEQMEVRVLAPGQLATSVPASRIRYEVELSPPARRSDAAFISWLTGEQGMLHLSDILPVRTATLPVARENDTENVHLNVPEGWAAYSDTEVTALRTLRFSNLSGAVILLGTTARSSVRSASGKLFKVLTNGDWAFSGEEALDTVAKIIKLHSELGSMPCGQVTLALTSLTGISPNNWSAETRGCTVTLLMGKLPSKTAALAQLGNALTHELFHLWIPNGIALTGDYDWFYEGFTMYQAARAAVKLGYVSFPEFLNAIARAYDASMTPEAQRLSLIGASKQRWTNGAASVYSKAMVLAFLCDLNLRFESKGKRSLDDIYRTLLREHQPKQAAEPVSMDGNAAVASALESETSRHEFAQQFLSAPVSIDLQKEISPFGLRAEKLAVRTHISVGDHLSGRQRDLLKQLGYNEPRARRK